MGFGTAFARQPSSREGATQTISYGSTSTTATNRFGTETNQVRLVSANSCCYAISDGTVTAFNTSPFLPANTFLWVTVTPGQGIAAIQSSGGGSGTLFVTETS
jgi:hypothetical protein